MSSENPILILSAAWTEEWRMGITNKHQRILFIEHLPDALAPSKLEAYLRLVAPVATVIVIVRQSRVLSQAALPIQASRAVLLVRPSGWFPRARGSAARWRARDKSAAWPDEKPAPV